MMECTNNPLFSPARNMWSIFPGGMREQQGRLSSDRGQQNHPEIKSEVSPDHHHHHYNDQQNVLTPPSSDPPVSPTHDDSSCSSSPPPHNHQDQDSLNMMEHSNHSNDSPETKKEKLKQCKQCSIIFTNKDEYFEHLLVHIKPGKALRCGQCKFVTEYKHHLEYHIRKHTGDKPYKCELCQYACTNKSMLTSHMKSHSSLYAYNCANCPYKAKYQHTFKEHLRKNGHKPGMILNEDGTINHTAVIDLESRRRGPRTRQRQLGAMAPPPQSAASVQTPAAIPQIPPLINPALIPMFYQPNIQDILMHMLLRTQANVMGCHQSNNDSVSNPAADSHEQDNPDEAIDLSSRSTGNRSPISIVPETPPRRDSTVSENYSDLHSEESGGEEIRPEPRVECNNNNENQVKECEYCGITFRNSLMHYMHMSFHSKQNPLTCSKCSRTFPNNILFFDHVQTFAH